MGWVNLQKILCALFCFGTIWCLKSSVKFVNVDIFEGNILSENITTSTVQGCVAACAQHTSSCHGSKYNVVSKECQLLEKGFSALTMFYADGEWTLHMAVRSLVYAPNCVSQTYVYKIQITLKCFI